MTKVINKIYVFVFMALLLVAVSCNDDDAGANSGQTELLSFGPTGVQHGEKIIFIGKNLDKVTAVELAGVSVPSSSFTSFSPERIELLVPQEATAGVVVLKTEEGDITSKTVLSFEVPVTIASITPEVRPGGNLTITGNFLNWVTGITFGPDVEVTEVVSQTLSELVVKVPMEAKTGKVFLSTGGTKPLVLESEADVIVTLPTIASLNPNPAERGGNVTITGTDLDLVEGVLFKGLNEPIIEFVNKTATELTLTVPTAANKGKITLITYSKVAIESEESLTFIGDLPDLAPLAYAFYVDALQNNWQNWGWGSTVDFGNTENVRDGNASVKVNYTGSWGALKFANGSVSTADYTEIAFSVFGTPGTEGKKINISPSGGSTYVLTVQEGKWVEYKLTKADFGNPTTITEFVFQNQDWSGVIYLDQVGLR